MGPRQHLTLTSVTTHPLQNIILKHHIQTLLSSIRPACISFNIKKVKNYSLMKVYYKHQGFIIKLYKHFQGRCIHSIYNILLDRYIHRSNIRHKNFRPPPPPPSCSVHPTWILKGGVCIDFFVENFRHYSFLFGWFIDFLDFLDFFWRGGDFFS